jgi:hypothetical protein
MTDIGTGPPARVGDFPQQLDEIEIENHCARESFTWGPQATWLLAGLIWLFLLLIRDVPDVVKAVLPFALGAIVLAGVALWYEWRRRNRRIALLFRGSQIGCYRARMFQYSFARAEMVLVPRDWFSGLMVLLKLLGPMLVTMVIVVVVMYDALKQGTPQHWQDLAVFIYAFGYALFGFVAVYRSNFRLLFVWIPDGKGKTNQPVHLHPREFLKLQERRGVVIVG